MYTPRFRSRNILVPVSGFSFSSYARIDCVPGTESWRPYYSQGGFTTHSRVDYMDDVTGDKPKKGVGTSGYRFHPMSKGWGEIQGITGEAVWLVTSVGNHCDHTQNPYKPFWRRDYGGNSAAIRWSGLQFPMKGDRVDLEKMDVPWVEIERLRGLAETEVLAKRGKYGESNLYESLAEVNRAIGMLGDIFNTARRIQDSLFFKRGGVKKLRGITDQVAGQYLATRYGFGPLVKDIEAILLGLEKPLGRMLRTTRAEHQSTWTTNSTMPDEVDAGTVKFTRAVQSRHRVSVRSMSLDHVDITLLGSLGLGGKDLMSVPLELMSYSFIMDWFANIGNFVGALLPNVGISNVGMSTTIQWDEVKSVYFGSSGLASVGQAPLEIMAPPPISRVFSYRSRTPGPLSPALRWQSDFKFDQLTRSLDALALLMQQAKRVKPRFTEPTSLENIVRIRRRNPSQRGRRSASDFNNLTD